MSVYLGSPICIGRQKITSNCAISRFSPYVMEISKGKFFRFLLFSHVAFARSYKTVCEVSFLVLVSEEQVQSTLYKHALQCTIKYLTNKYKAFTKMAESAWLVHTLTSPCSHDQEKQTNFNNSFDSISV